jgi:endonuclease/exonuclease/phosphatase family metal-dependent hydrolase
VSPGNGINELRPVRVMDLNLWNLNEPLAMRMTALSEGLSGFNPDLACFQEVSMISGFPQVEAVLVSLGYRYIYYGTGEWKGREEGIVLAWKSDWKLIESSCQNLPHRDPDMSRGILAARLTIGGKEVLIATTHLAYRISDRDLRNAQAECVVAHLRGTYERWLHSLILCGDFNDIPTSGIPQVFVQNLEVYDAQDTLGMGEETTFSSRNAYVDPVLVPDRRIDYIMPSQTMTLSNFQLAMNTSERLASDHYALIADLVI